MNGEKGVRFGPFGVACLPSVSDVGVQAAAASRGRVAQRRSSPRPSFPPDPRLPLTARARPAGLAASLGE